VAVCLASRDLGIGRYRQCPITLASFSLLLSLHCKYTIRGDHDTQAGSDPVMTFGKRLRELRRAKGLSQRALADQVKVNFTYLSRCETGTLDFGQYPSEDLIRRLAAALEADEDELLVLAKKVLPIIRERVFERPEAFSKLARLDDAMLDRVMAQVSRLERKAT
jgi:HTH-type transcriptional regulator, competence development regulator